MAAVRAGDVVEDRWVPAVVTAGEALEQWSLAEQAAGRAQATLRGYHRHLEATFQHLAAQLGLSPEELELSELTRARVRAHLAAYRTQADRRFSAEADAPVERAPASVRTRLHAIRAFSRWALAEGLLREDATAGLRVQGSSPSPPGALSELEARELLTETAALPRTARDHLVCALILGLGLRVGEVAALRCGDVGGGSVRVRGRSAREVRTTPLVDAALAAYLPRRARAATRIGYEGDVLVLGRAGAFTADGLGKVVRRLLVRYGVEGDAQRLRATFATLALAGGVEVGAVRQAAGVSLEALRRLAESDSSPRSLAAHPLSALP